jgi:hypothetical protein
MKKILTFFLAFIPLVTFAQLIDELPKDENGQLCYSEVVYVDSLKKNQLYLNAKQFFNDSFSTVKDVIHSDDNESAVVTGRVFNFVPIESNPTFKDMPEQMWYTLKIHCKDGRYKYEIYDISFNSIDPKVHPTIYAKDYFDKEYYFKNNGTTPKGTPYRYKISMENAFQSIIYLIKSSMSKSDSKNNW